MRRHLETAALVAFIALVGSELSRTWWPKPQLIEVPLIRAPEPEDDFWPERPTGIKT